MTFTSARRYLLLLSLAFLLSTVPLTAVDVAPGEWRLRGPDGGLVTELVAAPGNPQVLYAVAQGMFFRSVDGGATWTRGSDDPRFHVAVDAANPSLVYAVRPSGLARSADGGATWRALRTPAFPNELVAHPRLAGMVFAVANAGLFKSNNGGSLWRLVRRGGLPARYQAHRLVIDPSAPRRFYLALTDVATGTPQLFKSLDGGFTWQRIDNGPLAGKPILALAPHPRSPRILYAATAEDVYRSVDGGSRWTAVGHAGGVIGITHLLAVQSDRPNVVYAAGSAGVFRSQDAGATWVHLPGLPDQASASALLALPRGLFVGISAPHHPGGVFKSTNQGNSWTFAGRGIQALTVGSIRFGEPGTLWIVADFLLFRSTDQGLTWSHVRPDPATTLPVVAVGVDPADPSNVFALISDGALWRSHDAGETWEAGGNAGLQARDLEVDPQNPSTLYAAGYGGIAKSTDGGNTWTPLPVENAVYHDVDVAPSSPSTLYAATEIITPFLLRSQDAGATWTRLSLVLRDLTNANLSVDPLVATTVFTADEGYVLKSTDAGETWSNFVNDRTDTNSIHPVETTASGRVYAGYWNEGVFLLQEGSPTLAILDRRFDWMFTVLAPDPHDACRVYMGADFTSLMVFTHTGTAECP